MHAHYQSIKFPAWVRSCDFSKLGLVEKTRKEALCKALHFREDGRGVTDAVLRIRTLSAQPQNLDRDVVRSPAFASQFDELAARLFRAFIFDCVKNLGVSYLSP